MNFIRYEPPSDSPAKMCEHWSAEKTCSDIREYLEATADRGSPDDVGDFEMEET